MMFRLAPLLRCLAVFWFATAAAALAEQPTLDAARAALDAGAFLEAAELGKAEGSAEGLAFAAKALGYHGRCVLDDRPAAQKPIFQRAYDLAVTAVERDPDDPEAWTQRARSYARLLNFDKASMSLDQATKVIERLDSYLSRANALAGTRAEPACATTFSTIARCTISSRWKSCAGPMLCYSGEAVREASSIA